MTLLVTATPKYLPKGEYNIDMEMTSGDARIQISVDGRNFKDIANSVKTADANFNIRIPKCAIQAVITGNGTVNFKHLDIA